MNFCDILRDDGASYGDYIEQLTYLLFPKSGPGAPAVGKDSAVLEEYWWEQLLKDEDGNKLKGHPLEEQYGKTLQALQKEDGMTGIIFEKAKI